MPLNSDFSDLLRAFERTGVRYLIVGGYAVMHYTEPRFTKDLDIWIDPEPDNAERVFEALRAFGAPLEGVTSADFTNPELVYQVGVAPLRVDILMGVPALSFAEAWSNRARVELAGQAVYMISRPDLLKSKRASARLQDLLDAENLAAGTA